MSIISLLVLGIVQGLSEFLPVSSSGHLVIFQKLIPGFSQPGVLFDVVLHFGTTFSVILYFRKNIIAFIKENIWNLLIGSIPAGLLGVLFSGFFEKLFLNLNLVGFFLLITSLMNFLTDKQKSKTKSINLGKSFFIGIFQALAMAPGISRSGSTIFAGSLMGIDKKRASEFSFILSIPAVIGANIIEIYKYTSSLDSSFLYLVIGFLASLISGYFAIKLVLKFLERGNFKIFAIYAFVVGMFIILF